MSKGKLMFFFFFQEENEGKICLKEWRKINLGLEKIEQFFPRTRSNITNQKLLVYIALPCFSTSKVHYIRLFSLINLSSLQSRYISFFFKYNISQTGNLDSAHCFCHTISLNTISLIESLFFMTKYSIFVKV